MVHNTVWMQFGWQPCIELGMVFESCGTWMNSSESLSPIWITQFSNLKLFYFLLWLAVSYQRNWKVRWASIVKWKGTKVVVLNTVWLLKCSILILLKQRFHTITPAFHALYLAILFFLFLVFRSRGFFFTRLVYGHFLVIIITLSTIHYFYDIFQAVFHCVYKVCDSILIMFHN